MFLKKEDVILSNDAWRVATEINVDPYEDAVLVIRNDLRTIYESSKEFTSINEVRQIEVLLDKLETRIQDFRRLLPKPDSRRGLMNIGGTALKALFGVATASDVLHLHQAVEELATRDTEITHSLLNQLTYIKSLDSSSRLQMQSLSNLSSVVKNFMIDSHDRFYETTRDILWLNVTVHSQSRVYMAVRQLEFALFQLTQHVEELLAAVQYALQGKLPITLIGPSVLHDIIRNVTFHLPEGYELLAGTRKENIWLYYEAITVAMFGDSHGLRLVMTIPVKTTEQLFSLYELVALPEVIAEGKFVRYLPEYPFFGLSLSRRDYVLWSAADLQECSNGNPKVCPANVPIYDAKTPSCEASMFFQTSGEGNMCKRSLLLNYSTPTLRKHGEVWLYNFPRKQQVTIRCPHGTSWETYEKILFGSGLIHNATSCSIGTPEVRTLPELHRTSYMHLDTPVWYAPNPMPGLVPENSSRMKEDLPAAIHALDDINAQLSTPLRSLDVDTLLHTRLNALRQGHQAPWYLAGATISGALAVCLAVGYFLQFHRKRLLCDKSDSTTPESNQAPQVSPRTHVPEYATVEMGQEQRRESVTFASHSLRMAD